MHDDEARPSLVVRGEEELVARIHAAHVTRWCISFTGNECPEAKQIARALLEDGTVTVAPSLVAESREAVLEGIRAKYSESPPSRYPTEAALADALLAPGGPVRLADATPERGWAEGVQASQDARLFGDMLSNPYDGFTRKETNDDE